MCNYDYSVIKISQFLLNDIPIWINVCLYILNMNSEADLL